MSKRPISFERAKAAYVHRYTLDHYPHWARQALPSGRFPAPQYRSDREWYDKTLFHGESDLCTRHHCYSSGQTWPLGQSLDRPFHKLRTALEAA